ncbi:MAG TPA: DUF4233 domain-containing protein [Streptosporangiaceae bacterium]|jgi:hypothetical protein|nr:DUF4233 domain-containing protein [Streptosporangiaceae bacterium]
MNRLCAMVLVCEALVIALAIPVAIKVGGADAGTAGAVGGIAAVACVLLAGLLRHRWAFVAGGALQVLVILSGMAVSSLYFLGAIFGALWITAIWLGRRVEGGQAR